VKASFFQDFQDRHLKPLGHSSGKVLPLATKPYRRLRVQFTAQKGILQANSAEAAGAGCFAWLGSKQGIGRQKAVRPGGKKLQ